MKIASVRKHALSLEAVTEEPHHDYSSFRVRGKIFVTVPPAEDFIHVFVGDEDRERALALYPDCVQKLLWEARWSGCASPWSLPMPWRSRRSFPRRTRRGC